MSEERIMILTMLQEGKISSEEAAKLLDALDEAELKGYEEYTPNSDATSIPMEDFDPMEGFDPMKKSLSVNKNVQKAKDYEKKFEDIGRKIEEKFEKKSQDFDQWGEKIEENFEKKAEDFERWGENFGDKFGEKFEKFGENIAVGAESFADRIVNFIDNLVDKGSFSSIFGGYDTITENIEKDISDTNSPSLEFQAVNGKITVHTWDEEKVSVKAVCQLRKGNYDINGPVYESIVDGGRYIFKPIYKENMGIRLEVFIPKKHYERIFLFTTNGKIDAENIEGNELLLDTTNASIRLNDIHSDRVKACTKNGRIIALDVNSRIFDADTSNASIELVDINCTHVEALTRNGKISASDVASDILNLTTSNAHIGITDCSSKNIKCKTSNSSIKVNDIDINSLNKIELNTSNGQIEMYVDDKSTVFNLDLKTSMGHIDIDIPNLVYTLNNQQNLGSKKILAHSSNFTSEENVVNIIASTSNGSIKIG